MSAHLAYPGARLVPVGVRALAVVAAAGGGLLQGPHAVVWTVAAAAVTALVAARAEPGASPAPLLVLLVGWSVGYGSHPPALPRTMAFAALLLLVHESLALAGDVPVGARVSARVITGWLRHLGLGAGAVVAVAGAVAVTGRVAGSAAADVVGVAGVLVVVFGLAILLRSGRR